MSAGGKSLTDCPSNLKEAIDWILRVTGKDGGQGGTKDLAGAVKELLSDVSNGPAPNGTDADPIHKLKDWLAPNQNGEGIKTLIESLAEGLATFIGYQHNNANGLIGTGGIAVSNDPLERLRDGVLGFIAGFSEQLKGVPDLKKAGNNINNAINALKGGIGRGKEGFSTAIKGAENALKKVNGHGIQNILNTLKNVNGLNVSNISQLSKTFQSYLQKVLEKVAEDGNIKKAQAKSQVKSGTVDQIVNSLMSQLPTLFQKFNNMGGKPINLGTNGIGNEIKNFQTENAHLQPSYLRTVTDPQAKALASAVYSATTSFRRELQKQTYVSSYPSTATWDENHKSQCAMIFLGCIPLYYYGLTYLYWQCRSDGGVWARRPFGNGNGYELRYFMAATGFDINQLNSNTGQSVMTAVAGNLSELKNTTVNSFPELLNKIQSSFNGVHGLPSTFNGHTIAALIHCAAIYFQCKRRQNINKHGEPPPPTTIREMLYWLTGLTITSQFADLLGQFKNAVPHGIQVAVSGSSGGNGIQPLTADDLSSHLIPACILCPNILGLIQGAGASTDSEPWLHGLFGNALNLSYPSGRHLFSALCDYVYAVQFQLSFLVQMCISGSVNGGWQNCRYGKDVQINGKDERMKSWICPLISGCKKSDCKHDASSRTCNHVKDCGKGSNHSPLQAFLTDCLEGFRHNTSDPVPSRSPNYPNHYGNHPKGFMCHVPMGFTSETLRAWSSTGNAIYMVLRIFSGTSIDPFRKLCENLVCLTKRTPKTLGDLFGFYWHFCNQVFNKRNIMDDFAKLRGELRDIWSPLNVVKKINETLSPQNTAYAKLRTSISSTLDTGLSRSLRALQSSEALFFFLFQTGIPNALDGLARHCHKETNVTNGRTTTVIKHNGPSTSTSSHKCSETPNDLWSLHRGVTDPKNRHKECAGQNCGGYLNSLTLASGAVFAPDFAATYLSWLVYLTEEFYEWLNEFLVSFNNISCEHCTPSCNPGKTCHSTSTEGCKCKSVVWCTGVLSLFYQYGFNFASASSLNGQYSQRQTSETVRTCQKFAQQLRGVLAKDDTTPLWNLIKTIDIFLFYVRLIFLLFIGSVWTLAFAIIFKILIIKLDLLHIKSHMHLPSSHKILPSALLTANKASTLTKLIDYMQ